MSSVSSENDALSNIFKNNRTLEFAGGVMFSSQISNREFMMAWHRRSFTCTRYTTEERETETKRERQRQRQRETLNPKPQIRFMLSWRTLRASRLIDICSRLVQDVLKDDSVYQQPPEVNYIEALAQIHAVVARS